jgi:tetratricopeptide (TPR) repeat protein
MADKAANLAKAEGTDRERDLIHALQLRYHEGGGGKRGDLNFARAMADLAARYPDDGEIAVIAADAWLMTPAKTAEEYKLNARLAMPLLERVLRRSPNNTAAIHFYIHATELAGVPQLAEPYANKLAGLAPNASHLVHMPSHTFYWVGRYEDAAKTNMRAVEIGIENAKRLGLPAPDGVWGLPYHTHNVTFGLGGALEAGDAELGLKLARPLVAVAQTQSSGPPFRQVISANGYFAMAQFAPTAEVLALPEPKLPILKAAWHYARGEAFARSGDVAGIRREASAIVMPAGDVDPEDGSLQARSLTQIARNVLVGRASMIEHRPDDAAIAFSEAAELQESKDYSSLSDPPAWAYPVRRDVAEALLAKGDAAGARRELEAALKYRPRDPGSLALLAKLPHRDGPQARDK